MGARHFLDLDTVSAGDLRAILESSASMKRARDGCPHGEADPDRPLAGRMLALLFEKPSTRTRISFDVAMRQLGGEVLLLRADEMQLGRGETVADTARVLSRYVDAIMIRAQRHENIIELAEYAEVPVINGLTDRSHPCQIMADVLTFEEHKGPIRGRKIAWVGDGNNVATSWVHAAQRFDFALRLATPRELAPNEQALAWARETGADVRVTREPDEAAEDADCIVADTWVSMGDKDAENRHNLLAAYQVDARLMSRAAKDAIFMHCLPAHRGEEMTADVIDGPQSVVWDEAENRLHTQKGILRWCLEG